MANEQRILIRLTEKGANIEIEKQRAKGWELVSMYHVLYRFLIFRRAIPASASSPPAASAPPTQPP